MGIDTSPSATLLFASLLIALLCIASFNGTRHVPRPKPAPRRENEPSGKDPS